MNEDRIKGQWKQLAGKSRSATALLMMKPGNRSKSFTTRCKANAVGKHEIHQYRCISCNMLFCVPGTNHNPGNVVIVMETRET